MVLLSKVLHVSIKELKTHNILLYWFVMVSFLPCVNSLSILSDYLFVKDVSRDSVRHIVRTILSLFLQD
jgi:hypothetical protein